MRWTIYLTSVLLTLTLTWSSPMLMVSGQQSDGDTAVSESLTSPTINSNTEAAIVAEAKAATGDAKQPPAPTTTSLTTSLLSGLFDTITTTSKSKDCPGRCVHVLAALLCEKVLDNVSCSESSMRCCVENRPQQPTRSTSPKPPPPPSASISSASPSSSSAAALSSTPAASPTTTVQKTNAPTTSSSTTTSTTTSKAPATSVPSTTSTTTTTTTKATSAPSTSATTTTIKTTTTSNAPSTTTTSAATTSQQTAKESKGQEEVSETSEEDDAALKASAIGTLKVCPGVCVSNRISDYCEAVLNVEGLCKTEMKCCVTKSLFGDGETPPELVILNENSGASVPSTTVFSSTAAATTAPTTTTTPRTTTPTPTTTRPKPRTSPTTARPSIDDDKRCKGTCVTGFFSYLCDFIDSKAVCANGGKCCISRREGPPSGSAEQRNGTTTTSVRPAATTSSRPVTTTEKAAQTVSSTVLSTSTTTKPTTTNAPKQKERCPGVCLPGLMSAFCSKPSVVIKDPPNLCENGAVCCDSKTREIRPTTKPSSGSAIDNIFNNPLTSLLAGPLLSSLAGAALNRPSSNSGGDKSDASPQRPQNTGTRAPPTQAPTTTTTTTTTSAPQPVDTRPYCPGTCMAPILSFSCFSNAEITDLFRCPSSKVVCCAPKSAIRELRPAAGTFEIPQTEFSRPGASFRPPPLVRPGTAIATVPQQPQGTVVAPTGPRPAAPRPQPHSKFVCGVKGTHRELRSAEPEFVESNSTSKSLISRSREGRVVGGRDALPGEYCWQVALINSLNQYLCGGALIGTQWVLTAAHCVTNIVRSGDAIYVRVGDHDLTSRYGSPGAQTLRVATTYIHHNHNSQTLDNDIALLKLQGQAELKPGVCIICLPSRGSIPETGRRCTVTGYGYMGETGPIPLRVREAEVPIVSESECVRQINAVTEKIFIMPASSFCAGGEADNDACQGDGGGPLVCEDEGYYELSGLVSWGFGCGRAQVPGVYVKVSAFISWINQIISVNNV
uniref:EOG090X03V0 n=1 Tax=Eubosmina coregoni TaxID=186181 RepID=A0A4Y7LQT5_9CRUS|nr:EOG090X03V0 [Eubosmina coregoni]SVE69719.1 EOG090X03V0 [Eubosmina coregoni]